MGTRHLIIVIADGETKEAQYGQWDGYPSGQGATILEFLKKEGNIEALKNSLKKVRFMTEEDNKEMDAYMASIGSKDGWMTMEQSDRFHKRYPHIDRDLGAKILERIINDEGPILLRDSTDFAADSLFCEWAYVINLDTRLFEVYKGFNQQPLDSGERFANLKKDGDYYPVKLVQQFLLSHLPTQEELELTCDPVEEQQ